MSSPFAYPVDLILDGDVVQAALSDFEGAVTFGETREAALQWAADLLETVISHRIAKGLDLPKPSPMRGRPVVCLSPLLSAKAGLYVAWRKSGLSKAELARRLGWHPPQIVRLFDLRHRSSLEQVNKALSALGKRLVIDVANAACPPPNILRCNKKSPA